MQVGTKLTSNNPNIYGLGERVHNFRLDPQQKVYTMFSADHGTAKNMNLYGVHPIYMEYNRPSAHGVFLLNSNAMDVAIDNSTLTYKVSHSSPSPLLYCPFGLWYPVFITF